MAGVLWPCIAQAQSTPDAGSLRQQIERERDAAPLPRTTLPPQELQAPSEQDGFRLTVTRFRFDGNTLVDDETLADVVKPYTGRPVGFSDLQNAAAAVGEFYRESGWVVRSFLPEQDIEGGVVTIQIIEAKFGKASAVQDSSTWLAPQQATRMVAVQQESGQPLSTRKLDRALLLIDDLPGVAASGRLQEGAQSGETDLALTLSGEAMMAGIVAADNMGARATGRERLQGNVSFMSPFGMGDQTSAYLLYGEGIQFGWLEQTFPVGNDGLRVGFNASAMRYRLVPSEFDALDGKGRSTSVGLQASYPLIRARNENLYIDLNYDHRTYKNKTQGATSSHYNTDSVIVALRGNMLDDIAGGGSNRASIGIVAGDLDLGSIDTGEDPDLDDRYSKLVYDISREQTITPAVSFYAGLSGQLSREEKLDSSETFYLGGPAGVRAYPVSEGSGVSGNLATAEIRWNLAPGYQIAGFYDHGHVINDNGVENYALKGAGVEVSWQSDFGMSINATWAHRIGDNPNPTATGRDQDGSLEKDRFWLRISQRF